MMTSIHIPASGRMRVERWAPGMWVVCNGSGYSIACFVTFADAWAWLDHVYGTPCASC